MKIVHLINYFQTELGYQEYNLARVQASQGHKVWVVTSDRMYPFPDYENAYQKILGDRIKVAGWFKDSGFEIVRLPLFFEYQTSAQVIIKGIYKTLKEISPDIVHCHGVLSFISFQACFHKSRLGYKLIFDNHSADFNTDLNRTLLSKFYSWIFLKKLTIPLIKKTNDGIFAISEPEKKFLTDNFDFKDEEIGIINLGVDTKIFKPSTAGKIKAREELKIKESDIILVMAGKISSHKGIDILLKAVVRLKNHNIVLLFVGSTPHAYKKDIQDFAKTRGVRIIWVNFVSNRNLSSYFQLSDIAVWPGNPSISMLEAMGCGLPLITKYSDSTRYLKESKGVLFFKKKSEDLSQNIKILLDGKMRNKMGQEAVKFIKNKLSWDTIGKKVEKFYKISENSSKN